MIILLEGIDCSGKTTLLNQIKEYYNSSGYPTIEFHQVGSSICLNEDYQLDVLKLLYNIPNNTVVLLDRGFISNKCYGKVFKDQKLYPDYIVTRFLEIIDSIIICHIKDKNLWWNKYLDSCKSRSELHGIDDRMKLVYDEYSDLNYPKMIYYDYTIDDYKDILNGLR